MYFTWNELYFVYQKEFHPGNLALFWSNCQPIETAQEEYGSIHNLMAWYAQRNNMRESHEAKPIEDVDVDVPMKH